MAESQEICLVGTPAGCQEHALCQAVAIQRTEADGRFSGAARYALLVGRGSITPEHIPWIGLDQPLRAQMSWWFISILPLRSSRSSGPSTLSRWPTAAAKCPPKLTRPVPSEPLSPTQGGPPRRDYLSPQHPHPSSLLFLPPHPILKRTAVDNVRSFFDTTPLSTIELLHNVYTFI